LVTIEPPEDQRSPAVRRDSVAPIGESTVAILLLKAKNEILASLEQLLAGDTSFVRTYLARNLVYRSAGLHGIRRYIAVHRPGMKLAERVLSLFAADYLNDPGDYLDALSVCKNCGHVSFEGECVHVDSGFFPRGREEEQPFELVSVRAG